MSETTFYLNFKTLKKEIMENLKEKELIEKSKKRLNFLAKGSSLKITYLGTTESYSLVDRISYYFQEKDEQGMRVEISTGGFRRVKERSETSGVHECLEFKVEGTPLEKLRFAIVILNNPQLPK